MVLLHALGKANFSDLVVCHMNHCLREKESDDDESFVVRAAAELGFPVEVERTDTAKHAETTRQSLEAAARQLRYRFLAATARKHGTERIFLAHHAGDQVETILINFFRGSGPKGLSGMDCQSSRTIDGTEIVLLRPFLSIPRHVIDAYVEKHEIAFREDASNAAPFALRNRIRHEVMPLLRDCFDRDVDGAVLRSAELMRRLEEWADSNAGPLPLRGEGLDVAAMREMEPARRDRALLNWLREAGVPDCGFAEVSIVAEVLESDGSPAKANLPGGRHVRRRAGVLFLE